MRNPAMAIFVVDGEKSGTVGGLGFAFGVIEGSPSGVEGVLEFVKIQLIFVRLEERIVEIGVVDGDVFHHMELARGEAWFRQFTHL